MSQKWVKIRSKKCSIFTINFGRFSAPFWTPFFSQSCKIASLETCISHETSSKNGARGQKCRRKKGLWKSMKKLLYFQSVLGAILGPKNQSFLASCFGISSILAQASFKNWHLGVHSVFWIFSNNTSKIELSPAWQAQNVIFPFSKKCTFFRQQKAKIALSPALEHHFCEVSPVPKYAKMNHSFF